MIKIKPLINIKPLVKIKPLIKMEVVVEASLLKWFGAEMARFAWRFAQNTRSLKWLASLGTSRKTLRVMWFGP